MPAVPGTVGAPVYEPPLSSRHSLQIAAVAAFKTQTLSLLEELWLALFVAFGKFQGVLRSANGWLNTINTALLVSKHSEWQVPWNKIQRDEMWTPLLRHINSERDTLALTVHWLQRRIFLHWTRIKRLTAVVLEMCPSNLSIFSL